MVAIKINVTIEKEAKFLQAECGVRYWEDADVNGVEDEDGTLIPCRVNDTWSPLIAIDRGLIADWPAGTTADIHYKICDAGVYKLLDIDRNEIKTIDGYVPSMMCPEGNGYGDYVIMKIGPDGSIANWEIDLTEFEDES